MAETFEVVSVNISQQKGTPKHPVDEIAIDPVGVVGDAHAGTRDRQVSLLSHERIQEFSKRKQREVSPGEFAENLTLGGIDLKQFAPLDRLRIGDVELEVTQIGKECHSGCDIRKQVGDCVMPREGIFARVVNPGMARKSDVIEVCSPDSDA